MTIDNKQYLYNIANDTGSQEPTNRNLEIHSNDQTESKKLSQTYNYINNNLGSRLQIEKQIARKKPGFDSRLSTCYCGIVNKTQKQYFDCIENGIGCQLQENQKLKIHNNEQTNLKKLSQTYNYVSNNMADYLGINLQVARLLGQIYQDQNGKEYCYSSNKRLSYQCNISQRTVTNYIKKLQELGMIHSERDLKSVKHKRKIFLTNKFYEIAEQFGETRIKRLSKTWEEIKAERKWERDDNTNVYRY